MTATMWEAVSTGPVATRMAVVWCPDWPVAAWGIPLDEPAVVVVGNRVVASSPAAREEGVALGQRRRDAQSRCPDVAVLERDVDREARLFEPVAAALEAITPRVEVAGPGLVGFPTLGPSKFFGGDRALGTKVIDEVSPVVAGRCEVRVGIADGVFAARLAARATLPSAVSRSRSPEPVIVPPGTSPNFLADFSITTLEQPDLTDVLARLGLSTLGAFAELSAADVVGRFGRQGQLAHRLARGEDQHPPDLRRPAHDLAVTWMFDPPAETIDRCAFAAKALADELLASLSAEGLACVRVAIEAETDAGEEHVRFWRDEGALSAAALAERARWQLDAWLGSIARRALITSSATTTDEMVDPTAGTGIRRLSLVPDEVVPAVGRQLGFWGGRAERADDVTRVVARLQAMMGPDAVQVPERRGGRGPDEQISMVPAAAVDLGAERVATTAGWIDEPWPGRLPMPSPIRVRIEPPEIEVLDAIDRPVRVSGRGEISAPPALIRHSPRQHSPRQHGPRQHSSRQHGPRQHSSRQHSVTAWAGPWPADERWWNPLDQRRRARIQITLDDGSAHLLVIEQGSWFIEATY